MSSKTSNATAEDPVQEYDWGTGKSAWEEYQYDHGGEIPQDWPDQQLVQWVNQTRQDYWRRENGENTVSQHMKRRFGMLGNCGFDFGPNPDGEEEDEPPKETEKSGAAQPSKNKPATEGRSNNASTSTATIASTEAVESTRSKAATAATQPNKKPTSTEGQSNNAPKTFTPTIASTTEAADSTSKATAAVCAVQKSSSSAAAAAETVETASSTKRKRDEDDTDTDEDEQEETSAIQAEEEDSKPAARRSRRKTKKMMASNASPPASPPVRPRYPRRARTAPQSSVSSKALVASTGKRKSRAATTAATSSKQAKRKKTNQCNTHKLLRVLPKEQEEEVRQQIRKECPTLLKSQEPTKADKAKGVSSKLAESNKAWEERFFEFLVFKRVYGHGIIPKHFAENQKLSYWRESNRDWKKNKDKRMTKSRMKRLEQAGFVWVAKKDPMYLTKQNQTTAAAEKWTRRFNDLLAFKQDFGDCLVPKEYTPNMELSRWVRKQRTQRKNKIANKPSTLTDEQEKKLENAGFVWNARTKEYLRQAMLRANQAGVKGDDSDGVNDEAEDDNEVEEKEAALAEEGDEGVAIAMEVNGDGGDDDDDDDHMEVASLAEDAEVAVAAARVESVDVGDLDDDDDTDTEDEEEPALRPWAKAKPASAHVESAAMPKKAPIAESLETRVEKETSKDPSPSLLPEKTLGAEKLTLQAGEEEKKSDDIEELLEEPSADVEDGEKAVVESEALVAAAENDKAWSDGDKATAAAESFEASSDEGNAMVDGDKTEDKAAEGTDKTAKEVIEGVNDMVVETAAAKHDDKILSTTDDKAAKERESKAMTSKESTDDVESKKADPTFVVETSVATKQSKNEDGVKGVEKVVATEGASTGTEEEGKTSIEGKTSVVSTKKSKAVGVEDEAEKVALTDAGNKPTVGAKSPNVVQAVKKDSMVSAAAGSAKKKVEQKTTVNDDDPDSMLEENATAPRSVTEKKDTSGDESRH